MAEKFGKYESVKAKNYPGEKRKIRLRSEIYNFFMIKCCEINFVVISNRLLIILLEWTSGTVKGGEENLPSPTQKTFSYIYAGRTSNQ